MAITDYSGTAANNATVLGVNIGEGTTAPSSINNGMRQMCADIANGFNFTLLGTFFTATTLANARTALGVPEGSTSLTAFGNLTNTANSVPYMTGSDAWALATLTSFGRTLIDDGDAATARTTLGAVGVTASSMASGSSGYITLDVAGTAFKIQWVVGNANGETSTAINYPIAFTSWSKAVCTGGTASPSAEQNNPFVSSTSTTAATLYNSREDVISCTILAWGV